MLLDRLVSNFLGGMLAGESVIRADDGVIQIGKKQLKLENIFDPASLFN